jgi:hypothetical protein
MRRLLMASAAAVLLGCGGPERDAAKPGDTATTPPPPPPPPPPGFTTDAQRVTSTMDPSTGMPILAAVRTGRHEGFERIAFEFRGRAPGYRAEYLTGPAIACGSGDTVHVEGAAILSISFTPADAHEFDGEKARSSIPERVLKPAQSGGAIREARLTCDFEGEVAWAIGLAARRPMRAWSLGGRSVIVLDVATP